MSTTYPDAYLDHYADRYVELGLARCGIRLEQYLRSPQACERVAQVWAARGGPCPAQILPQEITAAEQRLERGLEDCRRRGGVIVEPLHHHRRHRRGGSDFARRAQS